MYWCTLSEPWLRACGRGLRWPHQEALGGVHQGEAEQQEQPQGQAEGARGGGRVRVPAQGCQLLPTRRHPMRQVSVFFREKKNLETKLH